MRLIPTTLLLALAAIALAAAYPSLDQYSQRREQRNDYRSVNNASDLRELLVSWGIDTKVPAQRGDIQVKTEQDQVEAKRGDVPASIVHEEQRRRPKRNSPRMWGYAEDEGLSISDQPSSSEEYQTTKNAHHHRKHHELMPGRRYQEAFWDRRRNDEERDRMQEMRRKQWEEQERRKVEAERQRRPEANEEPRRRPDLQEFQRNEQSSLPEEEPRRRQRPQQRDPEADGRRRQEERARAEEEQRQRQRAQVDDGRQRAQLDERRQRPQLDDRRHRRPEAADAQRGRNPETPSELGRVNEERVRVEEERRKHPNRADDRMSYEERLRKWQREKDEYEQRYGRQRNDSRQQQPTAEPPALPAEMDPRVQEFIRRNTPVNLRQGQPANARRPPSEAQRRSDHQKLLDEEQQRRADEQKLRDEEQQRRADEQKLRDEEQRRRDEELQLRAEEQQRRDEERQRTAKEQTSRQEEQQRRLKDQANRDDELKRRADEQHRRQEEERRRTPVDSDDRQQEYKRISSRIIIRNNNKTNSLQSLRQRPESTVGFKGSAASRKGSPASTSTAAERVPAAESPSHCVWAIVVCCRAHAGRSISKLGYCFEATDCLAVPWDEAACEPAKVKTANDEIRRFYLQSA